MKILTMVLIVLIAGCDSQHTKKQLRPEVNRVNVIQYFHNLYVIEQMEKADNEQRSR